MAAVALAAVALVALVSSIAVVGPVGIAIVVGAAVMALTWIALKYTPVTLEHLHSHTHTEKKSETVFNATRTFFTLCIYKLFNRTFRPQIPIPTHQQANQQCPLSPLCLYEQKGACLICCCETAGNIVPVCMLPVCEERWGDLCNQKPGAELEPEQGLLHGPSQ